MIRRSLPPTGFSLLELLLVIAIIGLLVSLVSPALRQARAEARLSQCLANLRAQGMALADYTSSYDEALPPRRIWNLSTWQGAFIDQILARHTRMPIPRGDWRPAGCWRCPDVADDADRATHLGTLHFAPNRWLFNTVNSCDGENDEISADIPEAWSERYPPGRWRRLDFVRQPSDVVSLIDNVNRYVMPHGHRDALESAGFGWEVVFDEGDPILRDTRMSHQSLFKHPAVMLDGHAESLPATTGYWLSGETRILLPGYPPGQDRLFTRDVQRFAWFVTAAK